MNVGEALHRWAVRLKTVEIVITVLTGKVVIFTVSVAITAMLLNTIK